MSDVNPNAEVAAAQADPVAGGAEGEQKVERQRDPETGKFLPPVGQEQKKEGDEGHFKALRREMRGLQKAAEEREARIRLQEERINTLLDVVERRESRSARAEDPLAHLPADDPDRPLMEKKILPLLRNRGENDELRSLKEEVAALRKERDQEKGSRQELAKFNRIMDEIAEDRGLSPEVAAAAREVILGKRVGGDTYEDAFDNALVYLKGSGKYPGNGQKSGSGKEGGAERTSVGGVMPGQAGAAVSSDDFRTLRKNLAEAREGDNAAAEARAFNALILKAQQEQGRAG